ncbi:MAG: hypothetical protein ACOX6H_01410 [Christensenellales bacterium]
MQSSFVLTLLGGLVFGGYIVIKDKFIVSTKSQRALSIKVDTFQNKCFVTNTHFTIF